MSGVMSVITIHGQAMKWTLEAKRLLNPIFARIVPSWSMFGLADLAKSYGGTRSPTTNIYCINARNAMVKTLTPGTLKKDYVPDVKATWKKWRDPAA
jgi:hypothetical protein